MDDLERLRSELYKPQYNKNIIYKFFLLKNIDIPLDIITYTVQMFYAIDTIKIEVAANYGDVNELSLIANVNEPTINISINISKMINIPIDKCIIWTSAGQWFHSPFRYIVDERIELKLHLAQKSKFLVDFIHNNNIQLHYALLKDYDAGWIV